MTLDTLVQSLISYAQKNPHDECVSQEIISWIQKHREFAFRRENLEGHITASLLVMNHEKTKLLLMKHKKLGLWLQFGGHADGELDIFSVALREFHEESGITSSPIVFSGIFNVHIHEIPAHKNIASHKHYDILYLATISEDTVFSRQEDEVDDIRWFEIEGIEKYIGEKRMLAMIEKIKSL